MGQSRLTVVSMWNTEVIPVWLLSHHFIILHGTTVSLLLPTLYLKSIAGSGHSVGSRDV